MADGRVTNRRLAGGTAYGLDYALGAGPETAAGHAVERGEPAGWWTDDVCDGGAVIDADRRALLFFSTVAHPAYRTAMLAGVRRVWNGWDVSWAHEGVADLARYVGEDPAAVRTGNPLRLDDPPDGEPLPAATEELATRVETYMPADAGLRAMWAELSGGRGARAAIAAMESARAEAIPAAAAAAKIIRDH